MSPAKARTTIAVAALSVIAIAGVTALSASPARTRIASPAGAGSVATVGTGTNPWLVCTYVGTTHFCVDASKILPLPTTAAA